MKILFAFAFTVLLLNSVLADEDEQFAKLFDTPKISSSFNVNINMD
jgi:hypothetical protein